MKIEDFQKVETRGDSTAMTNDGWISGEAVKRKFSTKNNYSKAETSISWNLKVVEEDI